MELIERYLQTIGRSLPASQRADILSELRSSLYDALEREDSDQPDQAAVIALIKQMGPPQQVAAAYYPAGQYLIGPSLYPIFRMVLGIVFTVLIGIQLFTTGFGLLYDTSAGALLNSSGEIINSLIAAFGSVVLVFWALQHLQVNPDGAKEFDPLALPALEADSATVSRGSHVFNIIINVVVLVILSRFAQAGGFSWIDGSGFFENPIISQYLPLIFFASLAEIVLDIVIMWHGYWRKSTRFASFLVNLFSLGLLLVILWAHDTWLIANGMGSVMSTIGHIPTLLIERDLAPGLLGMVLFRIGLVFALPVMVYEAIASLYFLIRALSIRGTAAQWVPAQN